MSFRSNIFRASTSLLLVVCFGIGAFADTIRLKDGSKVKGKIVSFSGGKFIVAVGDGSRRREMTLMAADIDSIDFDTPRSPASNVLASNRTTSSVPVEDRRIADDKPVAPPVEEEDQVVSVPTATQTTPSTTRKVSFAKPVELAVKVLADNTANGWTNSGWVVKKGQRIRISATGQVSIGRGKSTGPSGLYDLEDNEKLLKSVPTGALIAVIGDDNNEFIYIGAEREFTASRDGSLFLGLNEGNLNDNTGSFDVKIEISPDGGE
ncbi:MAG: LecA/PA-IL family lectin [Acidobacteriota bacterium]